MPTAKVKSKGKLTRSLPAHLAHVFATTPVRVPVSTVVEVVGNILQSELVIKFNVRETVDMGILVRRIAEIRESLIRLMPVAKGVDEVVSIVDADLLTKAIKDDSYVSAIFKHTAHDDSAKAAFISNTVQELEKEMTRRAINWDDLLVKNELNSSDDLTNSLKDFFDKQLSVDLIFNNYNSIVDYYRAIFKFGGTARLTALLQTFSEGEMGSAVHNIMTLTQGSPSTYQPMDVVSEAIGIKTFGKQKKVYRWNITKVQQDENFDCDISDVILASNIIEQRILGLGTTKALDFDVDSIKRVIRILDERATTSDLFLHHDGADSKVAEDLICRLFSYYLLYRVSNDLKGSFTNNVMASDAWYNIKRDATLVGIFTKRTEEMDYVMGAVYDVYHYLRNIISTQVEQFLVRKKRDRPIKGAIFNPYSIQQFLMLKSLREKALSTDNSPAASSRLFYNSFHTLINHAVSVDFAPQSEAQVVINHPKNYKTMRIAIIDRQNPAAVGNFSLYRNEYRNLPSTLLDPHMIMERTFVQLWEYMAEGLKSSTIAIDTLDIDFDMPGLHYLPFWFLFPSSIRSNLKGISEEDAHLIYTVLAKMNMAEVENFRDLMELQKVFRLPTKLIELLVNAESLDMNILKRVAKGLPDGEVILKTYAKLLTKDNLVMLRMPNRLTLLPDEDIFEYAWAPPSAESYGMSKTILGKYPILTDYTFNISDNDAAFLDYASSAISGTDPVEKSVFESSTSNPAHQTGVKENEDEASQDESKKDKVEDLSKEDLE